MIHFIGECVTAPELFLKDLNTLGLLKKFALCGESQLNITSENMLLNGQTSYSTLTS